MSIDKINITITHASLLHVWAYVCIVFVQHMDLERAQEDPSDTALMYWTSHSNGNRYPYSLEAHRRELSMLQAEDLIWVCFQDFVWHLDVHQLSWVYQYYFLQTWRKIVKPYHPSHIL